MQDEIVSVPVLPGPEPAGIAPIQPETPVLADSTVGSDSLAQPDATALPNPAVEAVEVSPAPERLPVDGVVAPVSQEPPVKFESNSASLGEVVDRIFDTPRVPAPTPTSTTTTLVGGAMAAVVTVLVMLELAVRNGLIAFTLAVPSTTHYTVPKPPG
jgi:hypothetical protein